MKDIIKIVFAVFVVTFVALKVRAYFFGPYGISSDNPLGNFEKLDAYLTGKMSMDKEAVDEVARFEVESAEQIYQYTGLMPSVLDTEKDKPEYLYLLVDADGELVGVAGSGQLPLARMGQGSKVLQFMWRYWKKLSGDGPERRQVSGYKYASFTTGRVQGRWYQGLHERAGFTVHLYLE